MMPSPYGNYLLKSKYISSANAHLVALCVRSNQAWVAKRNLWLAQLFKLDAIAYLAAF